MSVSRKGIGGRKPVTIENPFVEVDEWDNETNILWSKDFIDIRVEDMIIGCVRAFNAASDKRQEYVNWHKVYKVYRNCNFITRQIVQQYLQCSEAQAKRYIQVIKLSNKFMKRLLEGRSGSDVVGYPDMRMYAKQYKLNELKEFAE